MKIRLFTFSLLFCFAAHAQTVIFFDDFESGLSNWTVTGLWGTSALYAYSGSNSFTESPFGNYTDLYTATATMDTGVDLTSALDADVSFYAIYSIEEGFDFMYVDASPDGGTTWYNLGSFTGEDYLTPWIKYTFPLGAFVGNPDVRIRFRFESDMALNYDGMYIDDFAITKYNVDLSPPLITHVPSVLYEGTLGDNPLTAEIIDASGIASATMYYSVDGGSYSPVTGVSTVGDDYLFTVPEQAPGSFVHYYFTATDLYVIPNTAVSDTFAYVAGNYIGYDNAVVNFVNDIGGLAASGYGQTAVKITFTGMTDLVALVIQNYTDPGKLNDSINIHVWSASGGLPSADVIPSFKVKPFANFAHPYIGTYVDLRPYAAMLSGLTGDYFIGYGSDSAAWLTQTTPGIASRTYVNSGGTWFSITDDYHFRAVTTEITGAPDVDFSYDLAAEPDVAFTDLTTNSPSAWSWDFGDGSTSTDENPTHTYLTNGLFNVCLTASNVVGSDMGCQIVTIDSYLPPSADFSFSGDPTVTFTDLSTNSPVSWHWEFSDGTTSEEQNPVHLYENNGTYNVCLFATNEQGTDMECKDVTINGYSPVVAFGFSPDGSNSALINFTDMSTNSPTVWAWDFGDGGTSTDQNPSHLYANGGDFNVCLTASNAQGSNTLCESVTVLGMETLPDVNLAIYPNPASEQLIIHTDKTVDMQIVNIMGQEIKTISVSGDAVLPVSDIAQGYYQIIIRYKKEQISRPLIIQR